MLAISDRAAKWGVSHQVRFNKPVSKLPASNSYRSELKTALITAFILLAFLALSVWFAMTGWTGVDAQSHASISGHGYIAMAIGIVFSLLIGGGLMALVFYSARNGHDDVDHEL